MREGAGKKKTDSVTDAGTRLGEGGKKESIRTTYPGEMDKFYDPREEISCG